MDRLRANKRKRTSSSSDGPRLIGREEEVAKIRGFLSHHATGKTRRGSLYIAGPPGSGKSATVEHVLRVDKWLQHRSTVLLNCMMVRPRDIFCQIARELGLCTSPCSRGEMYHQQLVERHVATFAGVILIVLDEIDQLTEDVFLSLLESNLLMIGIANTFKISKTCQKFCPELITFKAYNRTEIDVILRDKFDGKQFESAAIEFCARKVAAIDGDLRKGVDICRHAVDMVGGSGIKRRKLSAVQSPVQKSLEKVTVKHISQAVGVVYGNHVVSSCCNEELPLLQMVAMATLVNLDGRKKGSITLEKFYDTFSKTCKHHLNGRSQHSTDSEFFSLCDMLESRGLLELSRKKEIRLSKVFIKVDATVLDQLLRKEKITSDILTQSRLIDTL